MHTETFNSQTYGFKFEYSHSPNKFIFFYIKRYDCGPSKRKREKWQVSSSLGFNFLVAAVANLSSSVSVLWTFLPQTGAAVKMCSVCINRFLWFAQLAFAVGSNKMAPHLASSIPPSQTQFNRVNSKVTKKPYNEKPLRCMYSIATFLTLKIGVVTSRNSTEDYVRRIANEFNETIRLWL